MEKQTSEQKQAYADTGEPFEGEPNFVCLYCESPFYGENGAIFCCDPHTEGGIRCKGCKETDKALGPSGECGSCEEDAQGTTEPTEDKPFSARGAYRKLAADYKAERDQLAEALRKIRTLDWKNAATNLAAYHAHEIARAALKAAEVDA